ncbi:hypothetical protein Lal_00042311 [Lupinus albus]|nr:hypothetical protein Lal_00042311 [Lupinus albus]
MSCLYVVENKFLTFVVDLVGIRKDLKVGGGSEGTCKVTQNRPQHSPRYKTFLNSQNCYKLEKPKRLEAKGITKQLQAKIPKMSKPIPKGNIMK